MLFVADVSVLSTIERSITVATSAAADLTKRVRENQAVVTRLDRLRRVEREAWDDLSPLAAGSGRQDATELLLRDVDNLAARLHLRVVSITVSPEMPAAKSAPDGQLLPRKVTLSVRGRFAGIARFVQELTRQRPLAELSIPRIALDPQPATKNLLESTIELTIYRLVLGMSAPRE